jgi:hypothetical protein
MSIEIPEEESQAAIELIEGGSELAGAFVGGALGLIGGPPGVAAGAVGGVAVTRGLKRVAHEIRERVLGPRQVERAGAALTVAIARVRERLDAGEEPRDDGFFDARAGERPDAEELLEGILLHAGNSYEERKVELLGRFWASLAFDDSISAAHANFLLRVADAVSYHQLVCLALVGSEERREQMKQMDRARVAPDHPASLDRLDAEIVDLGLRAVVGVPFKVLTGNVEALRMQNVWPTRVGRDLERLMELADAIPSSELDDVLRDAGVAPGYRA